jgi:dTDP-4-dehydrorhamnose 3,5-epimerase
MFEPQRIPDVILVTPRRFGDERGFFMETFAAERYAEAGIKGPFVQDNHSLSRPKGTLRGLHFQKPPVPQGKLVRCTAGVILDVAVDIRKGSPTYGRHVAAELSAENGQQLWVPEGFAHGFCTLTEDAEVQYKVTGPYAPDCDAGIAFDDPDLAIDWPVTRETAVLSDKDKALPRLADLGDVFSY